MADLAQRATTVGASTGRWDDGIESGTLSVLLVGYADLVRCRPQECLDGLAGTDAYAQRLGPAVVLTPFLDALRAAARFDLGERETGFTLMHHARAATVVVRARDEQVALVAVLAYERPGDSGVAMRRPRSFAWTGTRLAGTAEPAVMRATGPATISRFAARRG
jgi:hypothetical protein